jgi:hypothetical protein
VTRVSIVLALVAALALLALGGLSSVAIGHQPLRGCGDYPGTGHDIHVQHMSCAKGLRVIRAFGHVIQTRGCPGNNCRVGRFHCHAEGPALLDERCIDGARVVSWTNQP